MSQQTGPLHRVHRHIYSGSLTGPNRLAIEEHGRLGFLAFTDDDHTVDFDRPEHPTHGMDGRLITRVLLPAPHPSSCGQRGGLGHADQLKRKIAPQAFIHRQHAVHRYPFYDVRTYQRLDSNKTAVRGHETKEGALLLEKYFIRALQCQLLPAPLFGCAGAGTVLTLSPKQEGVRSGSARLSDGRSGAFVVHIHPVARQGFAGGKDQIDLVKTGGILHLLAGMDSTRHNRLMWIKQRRPKGSMR